MELPEKPNIAKQVYIGMAGDLVHPGHIELINDAKQYGEITIGLVSDKGMTEYKRLPAMPFEQRKIVLENIKGVKRVIKQDSPDYVKILTELKPDYVVKGDDWIKGQPEIRQRVIDTMAQWGGIVIDSKRRQNFSSTGFHKHLRKAGTTKEVRQARLQRLLESKDTIRAIEAHSGLAANIIENSGLRVGWKVEEYDAIWLNAKTYAISRASLTYSLTPISNLIHQVLHSSTKPIVIDLHQIESVKNLSHTVKMFERMGVSAVVISDSSEVQEEIETKLYPIQRTVQKQQQIKKMSQIISESKKAQISEEFMVFVRVESLIISGDLNQALKRSQEYIVSGADGILIVANKLDSGLLLEFCQKYKEINPKIPLLVSVSNQAHLSESELTKCQVDMVVYEDNLIKSVYPSMLKVAESILINKNTIESDKISVNINSIIQESSEDQQ
ncbi:adenylyltransferase/cytidyltransferase family protein [archaeon]|nr:adenylyltransferase/cytidyltransferase family protein [archaeon]MBT6762402.1 adenylyltransferase/cytidyltransferase family protein [archaeon]